MSIAGLPEPDFIERDLDTIRDEMIAAYEATTGKVLQPAQPERLFIDLMAYRELLVREAIQDVAMRLLLPYAEYPLIDYLGKLVGITRRDAQAALCTLQFTLTAAQAFDVAIPAGTRVKTADGQVVFATDEALTIAAGNLTGTVSATAQTTGVAGNGYLADKVTTIVDPVAYVASATNTTTSSGGAEIEDTESLRTRIQEAPEAFSVAGPSGAYRAFAMSASQDITDAAVLSPNPGEIKVYVLTADGLPGAETLSLVEDTLSDETVRPLADDVEALAAIESAYDIEIDVTLYQDSDQASVLAAVEGVLETYADERRERLGRDIVQSQIVHQAMLDGVYKVDVTDPAADIEVASNEWANCGSITVNFLGVADG